ncbi:metallophosphoesterase [Rubritalea tangerina]|uniref:Metallophosphoesterase n=1 Tax=Rubritalea tangerina TaxID=430798 RepID=A0ABW4Z6K8_9BACT
MALYCIGDIHGKFTELTQVLANLPSGAQIVCVGDIGLGFIDSREPSCLAEVDVMAAQKGHTVWLMRGNHDDPKIWHEERSDWNAALTNVRIPADIHRMKIENVHVIMVGGATSLDRSHPERIDNHNWWKDEAVDSAAPRQVELMVEAYGRADILITHAGPIEAEPPLARDETSFNYYSQVDPKLAEDVKSERELISSIVTASQARTVAFGHYHVSLESNKGPVRYRCCAELEPWQYVKRSILPPLPSL